jgi:dipeptidyl aminopeptidase/acylaminoacyl peptidase
MAVHGPPTPVLDDVAYSPVFGFAEVDASRTGTLVYRRSVGGGQFVLAWLDQTGTMTPLLAKPGQYGWPRLSPDGQRVALTATESGTDVLLVHSVRDSQTTRVAPSAGRYGFPLWTPDGQVLVVAGAKGLTVVEASGTAKPRPLLQSDAVDIPWTF